MRGSITHVIALLFYARVFAQNFAPNPSFEDGTNTPAAWSFWGPTGASGQWVELGRTNSRSVLLSAYSAQSGSWVTYDCPATPGRTYALHFWARSTNAVSGLCSGSYGSVYRDFPLPGESWQRLSMLAWIPDRTPNYLSLGQISLVGSLLYDDVEVQPTTAVHKRVGGLQLGSGEHVQPGLYRYKTPYSSPQYCDYAGNYARGLHTATASFASYKWHFDAGNELVFRHELAGTLMTQASLSGTIENNLGGTAIPFEVDVSTDGSNWQPAGVLAGGATSFNLGVPTDVLPAAEIYVRFSNTNASAFGLTSYTFDADVPAVTETAYGQTYFPELRLTNIAVQLLNLEDSPAGRVMNMVLSNAGPVTAVFTINCQAELSGATRNWTRDVKIINTGAVAIPVVLPSAGFGDNTITLTISNQAGVRLYETCFQRWVSMLEDDSYGERLTAPAGIPAWWCSGTFKVGRTRALPLSTNSLISISAARNEYEPFQIALRPDQPLTNVTVTVSDFLHGSQTAVIPATNVTVRQVGYVPVSELYYAAQSSTGDTADPLLPLEGPIQLPAFTNTTFWISVHVPIDIPAGIYSANVTVSHAGGAFTLPVQLKVFDFTLSKTTHTANVMNVVLDQDWHQATNDVQRRQIWNLYLENMAQHRITPYLPQQFDQIQSTFNPDTGVYTYDFTNFDAAMSVYLDDFHFTSFQWLDEIREDFSAGGHWRYGYDSNNNKFITPAFRAAYPRLVQPIAQHLREKGWFDRAYNYWIDEPPLDTSPAVLAMVKDGFQMVGEAVPGLRRMLPDCTYDFPKPDLYGEVDIWVPGFEPWSYKLGRNQERQAKGELIWPYVFMRPFSPWPNYFTDQPAASHRMLFWLGEKLNWDGELYWGINYYFNLPSGKRNPWTTPFVRDAGGSAFGNSDGALIYPPTKEYPAQPLIAGPLDSVRWEMIREGIEDREYFWLLKQLIADARTRLGANHPHVLAAQAAQSNALAFVPWPPAHPYRPEDMAASREMVAAAIEMLDEGRPMFASQPTSKAVRVGAAEYFQAEVLGRPAPILQWQRDGLDVAGGTNARLNIANATLADAGSYRLVATNVSGSVTSATVSLVVYGSNSLPQIIAQPPSYHGAAGARTVFSVWASSISPCTYQWLFNGLPINGATNLTLVMTNLAVDNVGEYQVVVSNSIGSVTSAVSVVDIPLSPLLTAQRFFRGWRITISSLVATGQVQASSNLVDWATQTNLPPSPTSIIYVDPVTNAPCRFYRVVIPR